jgi:CTD kinase subunit alpha
MLTVIDRLENMAGDWHEFESKALRKEKDREARREKEKRKASASLPQEGDRETKRLRQDGDSAQEP